MVAIPRRHAVFRYYAELNDFLQPARRFAAFVHSFELSASVKDMIESMGVPHNKATGNRGRQAIRSVLLRLSVPALSALQCAVELRGEGIDHR